MKRQRDSCPKCSRLISKSNYSRHFRSCDGVKREYIRKIEKCPYCGIDVSSICAGNHTRWCSKNPNRNLELIKKQLMSLEKARSSISNESRERSNKNISKAWENGKYDHVDYSKFFIGRKHSSNSKRKMSEARKKYLKENPEKHPWRSNEKFISGPCEYLKQKLADKGILFESEFMPLFPERYFSIDIALVKNKIGIEVNGEQHYNRDGSLKTYYKKRTDLIEEDGWKLLQIHYSSVYDDDFIENLIENQLI
jgi:hypothetical protein